jgi:hypothetical protein
MHIPESGSHRLADQRMRRPLRVRYARAEEVRRQQNEIRRSAGEMVPRFSRRPSGPWTVDRQGRARADLYRSGKVLSNRKGPGHVASGSRLLSIRRVSGPRLPHAGRRQSRDDWRAHDLADNYSRLFVNIESFELLLVPAGCPHSGSSIGGSGRIFHRCADLRPPGNRDSAQASL